MGKGLPKGRDAGGLPAHAHDLGVRTGSVEMALSDSIRMMISVMSGCHPCTCEQGCGLSGCSAARRHTNVPANRVCERAPSIFFVGGTHGMCAHAADQSRGAQQHSSRNARDIGRITRNQTNETSVGPPSYTDLTGTANQIHCRVQLYLYLCIQAVSV